MLRFILLSILITIVARAFWRVMDGVIAGVRGEPAMDARQPGGRSPSPRTAVKSVAMERDPICGTFVVPERAVALTDGGATVYFCSAACRDAYRSRGGARPTVIRDRTA